MSKNQNSGNITIANLVAMVGLVLLVIFSYVGFSYKSGGEIGWDIIKSVAITGFTAFLLWFLIKAKGAENQLEKWKKIEYATLAAYILFAIPASLFGGIMHFFVVNDNKNEIKKYAEKDIEKIEVLITDYDNFEKDALSRTGLGLRSATGPNQMIASNLSTFMEERQISRNRESAETYINNQRNKLFGSTYTNLKDYFENEKQSILNAVDAWSIMQISAKAKTIDEIAILVEAQLTEMSKEAKLPTIENENGVYTIIATNQSKEFEIEGHFAFKKALRETAGFSGTALLVVILIHLLILFNYIVAYRTNSLGVSKYLENDGGHVLK